MDHNNNRSDHRDGIAMEALDMQTDRDDGCRVLVDVVEYWCQLALEAESPALLQHRTQQAHRILLQIPRISSRGRFYNRLQILGLAQDVCGRPCSQDDVDMETDNATVLPPLQSFTSDDWSVVREQVILLKSLLQRKDADEWILPGNSNEEEERQRPQQYDGGLDYGWLERREFTTQYKEVLRLLRVQEIMASFRESLQRLWHDSRRPPTRGASPKLVKKLERAVDSYKEELNREYPNKEESSAPPPVLTRFLLHDLYSSHSETDSTRQLPQRLLADVNQILLADGPYSYRTAQQKLRQLLKSWNDAVLTQPTLIQLGYGTSDPVPQEAAPGNEREHVGGAGEETAPRAGRNSEESEPAARNERNETAGQPEKEQGDEFGTMEQAATRANRSDKEEQDNSEEKEPTQMDESQGLFTQPPPLPPPMDTPEEDEEEVPLMETREVTAEKEKQEIVRKRPMESGTEMQEDASEATPLPSQETEATADSIPLLSQPTPILKLTEQQECSAAVVVQAPQQERAVEDQVGETGQVHGAQAVQADKDKPEAVHTETERPQAAEQEEAHLPETRQDEPIPQVEAEVVPPLANRPTQESGVVRPGPLRASDRPNRPSLSSTLSVARRKKRKRRRTPPRKKTADYYARLVDWSSSSDGEVSSRVSSLSHRSNRDGYGSARRASRDGVGSGHRRDSFASTDGSRSQSPKKRRRPYTEEEKNAILRGVQRFGVGAWAEIKSHYDDVLSTRTNVNIKDCYRTMKRKGQVPDDD